MVLMFQKLLDPYMLFTCFVFIIISGSIDNERIYATKFFLSNIIWSSFVVLCACLVVLEML